ncbi:TrmH family RNA methyltransferase [Agarilytica rhodophyticola]|uniref:TrmH family RNA methyltransferase n=1 Tax=Agarilytica rhodophyticola TaxID=1737490 RepID=UPI000B341F81|nr:RNA methyltransferase [Agarilytica rhodophyticola]
MPSHSDSPEYLKKKKFFSQLLTIYGRKPVLEALTTDGVDVYRLHLSDSNKKAAIIDEIIANAKQKDAEILFHSKDSLARISKNKKQDQGVAIDLKLSGFQSLENFCHEHKKPFELIALDNITTPQNLGMIIRSVCASPLTGLLLPQKGCAKLDSLVIKASAGTIFKANIIRCDSLPQALQQLTTVKKASIIGLDVNTDTHLAQLTSEENKVFVLGNESEGLSKEVSATCHKSVKIPMSRGVESLNVAITAGLIAFRNVL